MKKVFLTLGCLLLAVACWLVGTKGGRSGSRNPAEYQEPNHESASSAAPTSRENSTPRSAPARPTLKNRPILLGKRVTVLEGTITESGSEGPVKFQNHQGMIFSASAIRPGEEDEILLVAPAEVTGEGLPGRISKKEGVIVLSKDGQLKAEGDMEFESSLPEQSEQQQE